MNAEFHIGQTFNGSYPPEAAIWCNKNGAYIEVIGEKRYKIKAIPKPTVDDKKTTVRAVRDEYINRIEWRVNRYRDQTELEITTTDTHETYIQILEYMQYLRDYPESSETWYEQNPLTFDEWSQQ